MTILNSQEHIQFKSGSFKWHIFYQKQMSGLPALLGDLHERALFDKHLQETTGVERKHHCVSDSVTVDSEQKPSLTLPGFSRSLLPFMLYSMWTSRSRFSWSGGEGWRWKGGRRRQRKQREMERRDYSVMDGQTTWQRMNVSLFAGE